MQGVGNVETMDPAMRPKMRGGTSTNRRPEGRKPGRLRVPSGSGEVTLENMPDLPGLGIKPRQAQGHGPQDVDSCRVHDRDHPHNPSGRTAASRLV